MAGREFEGKGHWREVDLFAGSVEHSETFGRQYATWIRDYLQRTQQELPQDASYLGLGVGRAYAEMTMAHELGIANERVALVDTYFSDENMRRLVIEHRGVQIIPADMFDLLQRPLSQQFSLVSAFGVEGQLQNVQHMRHFVTKLGEIVRPQGFVGVCPYVGEDMATLWEAQGFLPIRGHSGVQSALLYTRR